MQTVHEDRSLSIYSLYTCTLKLISRFSAVFKNCILCPLVPVENSFPAVLWRRNFTFTSVFSMILW